MGPVPAHHLLPVRSEHLQPGMYVAELDRSWLHAPFPSTGFLITGSEQVEQLRRLCHHVYIDTRLSETLPAGRSGLGRMAPRTTAQSATGGRLGAVRQVLSQTVAAVAALVQGARRQGIVDASAVTACASRLVARLVEDAALLHFCLRTEQGGGFLCRRAAGTAVVATTLAWRLGLDRQGLEGVATGALLLDLGKIAVPVPILAKPGALASSEQAYVRRHVERGLGLVAGAGLPERALEMMATHHERIDGSGYPHRYRGTTIPLFGRLAAIADAYDAMTLNRRYAAAMSPHAALRQLEGLAGEKYDAALVDELVQALGVYPCGTLVELDDGRVGLAWTPRPGHPLQPEVLVTHDARRQPLPLPVLVSAAGATGIFRSLPPSALIIGTDVLAAALERERPAAG
ncbi:MAG: DUF3391 domain-containing protein [Gammaproteobacteria bacterium]|nr:DUF3391 domain-containing protein [Gammaproteobacteria bacterium]QOJ32475.1 MAG: DUF3391 domain-containing protein [Gammaproteobacteria bacterium]